MQQPGSTQVLRFPALPVGRLWKRRLRQTGAGRPTLYQQGC
jgi:hypothetical protein